MSEGSQALENLDKPTSKSTDVLKSQEVEKQGVDAILVFGQGPVIEKETRKWAEGSGKGPGSEDVNFWSETLAKSASELYKRGQTREIIIMGGRTGGAEYGSEAELIGSKIEQFGIPNSAIKREEGSTNTLENIVNMLNEYPEFGKKDHSVGILGSSYHIGRLRTLMDMFDVNCKGVFSAEEVVRFAARDQEAWDQNTLLDIENRLNLNEAQRIPWSKTDKELGPGYYGRKMGEEQKNIDRRLKEDDVWRRVLSEVPEYWIGYLGRLTDLEKIRAILEKRGDSFLSDIKTKFQIDLSIDSDTELANKLKSVKRIPPEGKDWGEYVNIRIAREWGSQTQTAIEKVPGKEKDKETKVWFMRHAPTSWAREKKIQGNVETDIKPEEATDYLKSIGADNLPKPDIIVVSGLQRTFQTASALKSYREWGDLLVVKNSAFNERKWGILEGKTHEEARALLLEDQEMVQKFPYIKDPQEFQQVWGDLNFRAPNGETLGEVGDRVKLGLLELQDKFPGKNILLIAHAGVLQTQGLDFQKISPLVLNKE